MPSERKRANGPAEIDASLPPGVGDRFAIALGTTRPETLRDWIGGIRQRVADDDGLRMGDLCHVESGVAEARTAERRVEFHCVLDALAVPFLLGERTEIRAESPTNNTVTAWIDPDGDDETPIGAIVSIGAGPVDGRLSRRAIYEQLCAYVKPFESREAYQQWTDENRDIASMAIPFETSVTVARALIR